MLAALGLWRDLEPRAQAILEIKISDGRAGEGAAPWFLHFDAAEIDEGPMGHFLEDRWLRGALARRDGRGAADRGAQRRARGRPAPSSRAASRSTLADGARLRRAAARRLRRPRQPGRRRAPASARTGWDYAQTSLVCAVEHDAPHRGVAHQFFMPEGPLAILPLPGNRSSIVWTEATRPRRGDRRARRRRLPRRAAAALRRLPRRRSGWPARATPIRWACRSPSASSTPGWRWSATRRTASIRWPARG